MALFGLHTLKQSYVVLCHSGRLPGSLSPIRNTLCPGIKPHIKSYRQASWGRCVGGRGTVCLVPSQLNVHHLVLEKLPSDASKLSVKVTRALPSNDTSMTVILVVYLIN